MSATARQRLLALLASGHVANLPGIWSNVIIGIFLGSRRPGQALIDFIFYPQTFILAALLASCFFIGSSFLREAREASWDPDHPPDGPVLRGTLSPTRVAFAGYSLLAAGWFAGCVFESLSWATSAPAEVLPAVKSLTSDSIPSVLDDVSYPQAVMSTLLALATLFLARVGKWTGVPATLLIGLWRGLLVLWAASLSALATPWHNQPLLLYTTLVVAYTYITGLVAQKRPEPPSFLSCSLAGFCLLDALIAALIGWQVAVLCFALFLLTLLLQRLIPAP